MFVCETIQMYIKNYFGAFISDILAPFRPWYVIEHIRSIISMYIWNKYIYDIQIYADIWIRDIMKRVLNF